MTKVPTEKKNNREEGNFVHGERKREKRSRRTIKLGENCGRRGKNGEKR